MIEQDTHMGINTEFWITTNCWYWSKECDAEVINCLTLFIDVQKYVQYAWLPETLQTATNVQVGRFGACMERAPDSTRLAR